MGKTKTKKKVGAPKGTVNNPNGINQYANIKAEKPITVRLLKEQDKAIRARAVAEGKTVTEVVAEAIAVYLAVVGAVNAPRPNTDKVSGEALLRRWAQGRQPDRAKIRCQ